MTQQIITQPLPEEDRIELMIARTVIPRLSSIEGQMKLFNSVLETVASRQRDEQDRIAKKVETINQILNGDGKTDGLVAIVHDSKRWIDGEKKLLWILISVVTAETVGIFLLLLRSVSP